MHSSDSEGKTGPQPLAQIGKTNDEGQVGEPKIDEIAQAMIGRQLRAVYDEIVHEAVPDNLLKLLDELDRKEQLG